MGRFREVQNKSPYVSLLMKEVIMAEQDLIPVARGAVEAFNASDWEEYKTAMTSDCVYDEVGTSRILRGVGEIIRCFQEWKLAMPDVRGTVTNAWATGNTVVLEISWKGRSSVDERSPSFGSWVTRRA